MILAPKECVAEKEKLVERKDKKLVLNIIPKLDVGTIEDSWECPGCKCCQRPQVHVCFLHVEHIEPQEFIMRNKLVPHLWSLFIKLSAWVPNVLIIGAVVDPLLNVLLYGSTWRPGNTVQDVCSCLGCTVISRPLDVECTASSNSTRSDSKLSSLRYFVETQLKYSAEIMSSDVLHRRRMR